MTYRGEKSASLHNSPVIRALTGEVVGIYVSDRVTFGFLAIFIIMSPTPKKKEVAGEEVWGEDEGLIRSTSYHSLLKKPNGMAQYYKGVKPPVFSE